MNTTEPIQQGVIGVVSPVIGFATFGIDFWPFGIAFVFSGVALIYLDKMDLKPAFLSVIGSTLIGGTMAQLLAKPALLAAAFFLPFLKSWTDETNAPYVMTLALSIVIGLFCQKAMPALLRRADKVIGGQ